MPSRMHNAITLKQTLNSCNIDAEITPGYDIRNISNDEFERYSQKFQNLYYKRPVIGQLACLRAHASVMQQILDADIDKCLIFEDDISLNSKISEEFFEKVLSTYTGNGALVNLGGFEAISAYNMRLFDRQGRVNMKHLSFIHMMAGYSVDKKFCVQYLDKMEAFGINNDDWNAMYKLGLFNQLFVQRAVIHAEIGSLLDPQNIRDTRIAKAWSLKNCLFNALNLNKLKYTDLELY